MSIKTNTCWFFHKWQPWSDTKRAVGSYIWGKEFEVLVQTRRCARCNEQAIRRVA